MTLDLRAELQEALGVSAAQLNRLILRAPHTYKVYTIPKRTGGRRTIAQPARETKFLQHWLIKNLFSRLPVHACAMAYQPDSSIRRNAEAHMHNSYLAKFDFKNFFTSIKADALVVHFSKYLSEYLSESDIHDVARISCIKPESGGVLSLSIGAPSSPILSNSIMFEFDTAVVAWCEENGFVYTRYADDLAFSTPNRDVCKTVELAIRRVARSLEYPRLTLNNKKTTFVSKKYQRRVTGLIIANNETVSLGRDRKRAISSLIHKYSLELLTKDETWSLQGLLAFALDVEPAFIQRMRVKYGSGVIDAIFQVRK
jgi:RNA-directed DNA polymerase